jgi:hypothetical protein
MAILTQTTVILKKGADSFRRKWANTTLHKWAKINLNGRKSTKIDENRRKSTKIDENRRKSMKIDEHRRKSTKIDENGRKSPKIVPKTLTPALAKNLPRRLKKELPPSLLPQHTWMSSLWTLKKIGDNKFFFKARKTKILF